MAYFLFKIWKERLFFIKKEDVIKQEIDLPLKFVKICKENIDLAVNLRGEEYKIQFKYQLLQGDLGYYGFINDKPIAYGWIKKPHSDDYFFNITKGTRYLCRFFTHESVRGKGIYPKLINFLIEQEDGCGRFYIDVEVGNEASERGLKKVGFKFVKQFNFLRGFKITFNKYDLK